MFYKTKLKAIINDDRRMIIPVGDAIVNYSKSGIKEVITKVPVRVLYDERKPGLGKKLIMISDLEKRGITYFTNINDIQNVEKEEIEDYFKDFDDSLMCEVYLNYNIIEKEKAKVMRKVGNKDEV